MRMMPPSRQKSDRFHLQSGLRSEADPASGVCLSGLLLLEGASETGAAAEQALGAARELGQQANCLRSEVDGFLQTIRAA